jgi:hypothetical protein
MRELRLENRLKDIKFSLLHYAKLLEKAGNTQIAKWMVADANRIQATLDYKV